MKWTRDAPTEEGLFLYRTAWGSVIPYIVRRVDGALHATQFEGGVMWSVHSDEGAEWYGPLPEPED